MKAKELCRWMRVWFKNKNHNFHPVKCSFPLIRCSKCGLHMNHFGRMFDDVGFYLPKENPFGSPSRFKRELLKIMPICGNNTAQALIES